MQFSGPSLIKMSQVDIYSYQDFRNYLKDYYKVRRSTDRKFSIRFFARIAGLRSQNYLKVVMDGSRSLTNRNVPKFIKGLGLDHARAEYFEALVHLNQSRDNVEYRKYLNRVLHLQKKKSALTLDSAQHEFFTTWYHIVIFEMLCQDNFVEDPALISRRLKGLVTPSQVHESLELMEKIGIIKRHDKKLMPIAAQIAAPENVSVKEFRKFHDSFIEQASQALHFDKPEDREIRTLTIALTPTQLPQFKLKLKDFLREMNAYFSHGNGTSVYQLNLQFFKLTKGDAES
ncbi:MAG: TIGR02147 family protein [Oligoflexia bacterium]|nr:TIGR02147 family protein [Oligoflexia bacterium]